MTTLDIFALVLEIGQAGANANTLYCSESRLISVHITFPKGHKYADQERFYTVSVDDTEDIETKCKDLKRIKEALK